MIKKFIWILLFLPFIEFNPNTGSLDGHIGAYNENCFRGIENHSLQVAVIGDLQRTSLPEVLLNREQNDLERVEIVKSVSQENINAVLLLGDLVFNGSDLNEWKEFDNLISSVSSKEIPIFSIMGNHEYWGRNRSAVANVSSRFPQITEAQTWYCMKSDSVCFIFLDSNYGALGYKKWSRQINWFKSNLLEADNDQSIMCVIVFLHHPPYSNSLITGDDEKLQEEILPLFNSSKKSLAMISGHAHCYERFMYKGKTFIISGGGGGPRINLNVRPAHFDFCRLSYPRPFNYLLLKRKGDLIEITAKGLNKGSSEFFIIESFNLSLSGNSENSGNLTRQN
jgi:predicted phosphohydrolase